MAVDRIHSLGLGHLALHTHTHTMKKSNSSSIVRITNRVRTGNQGRGRCKGPGMTPDERRAFLAGKRPANTKTTATILKVISYK